jgi:hypothetical protein
MGRRYARRGKRVVVRDRRRFIVEPAVARPVPHGGDARHGSRRRRRPGEVTRGDSHAWRRSSHTQFARAHAREAPRGMPQKAPTCPEMPGAQPILQNEATRSSRRSANSRKPRAQPWGIGQRRFSAVREFENEPKSRQRVQRHATGCNAVQPHATERSDLAKRTQGNILEHFRVRVTRAAGGPWFRGRTR